MDRYNDVTILLKTWEQSFVQEHPRNPNKVDIDGAPEETKKFYKEYPTLKHTDPTPTSQTQSSEKDSGCWGTQLNRKSITVAAPKLTLTTKDRESSAQYFGMKLKSNLDLGALTKERPVCLKKLFTPRRTPRRGKTSRAQTLQLELQTAIHCYPLCQRQPTHVKTPWPLQCRQGQNTQSSCRRSPLSP
ncbi:ATP-dependent DNA helicase Q4-like isoform X1 [Salmo trutta]|uniref:ATP-dependent DNA helicase Q4-like isoform X1 n=1 Tax=Salmo trutta TaxID=8032 RepID=UPI0011300CC1|nr:ATP-dependent DNA helicase Q4-like isoform X1 [Salmo trutta]